MPARTETVWNDTPSTGAALSTLAAKLSGPGTSLRLCYEAGPCGSGVYRQLRALGHACTVVAPSLIPRRPGDREHEHDFVAVRRS